MIDNQLLKLLKASTILNGLIFLSCMAVFLSAKKEPEIQDEKIIILDLDEMYSNKEKTEFLNSNLRELKASIRSIDNTLDKSEEKARKVLETTKSIEKKRLKTVKF